MIQQNHVSAPGSVSAQALTPANPLVTARDALASGRKATRLRTRDLVGLLICHGARALRQSREPVAVRLRVEGIRGAVAVRYNYRG
ncbi:MAG: hypothetical protein R3D65_10010 [Zhengella sp.]|uniref:hypothetical protein n=1 Tax=Zhengella sp. TaxID=2282762 RepID=UPI001DADF02D|nr:hypothetical protein [Notoacmeibacter sp.]MCC0028238.1 hypothetical protein [Brucellaceae bacterium]